MCARIAGWMPNLGYSAPNPHPSFFASHWLKLANCIKQILWRSTQVDLIVRHPGERQLCFTVLSFTSHLNASTLGVLISQNIDWAHRDLKLQVCFVCLQVEKSYKRNNIFGRDMNHSNIRGYRLLLLWEIVKNCDNKNKNCKSRGYRANDGQSVNVLAVPRSLEFELQNPHRRKGRPNPQS